ncbi:ABC transporter substrate-binding protein [Vibrio vulnificus]|nr:ABC transporter substrate-binding protein [Vibrio vulnificus]EHU4926847.1 ABC transporter substrate-binding protein [Vibrio vulnificus]EIT7020403.1 ABC transporter substrate-binding protein [Vibrio vulnificus]EIV8619537.1 ABC transporter substrate-binding protein [Vibrio vulnificus]EIX4887428.1 ABC transporter substrate-binding protein [Vibrio vulnificus]EIZ1408919.1 ABC transporter substrate-binding protein [Vibrio vulnificus]
MRKTTPVIAITLLVMLLPLSASASVESSTKKPPIPVIVYADDAYPPYSYQIQGNAVGIYPDILRYVFDRMPEYRITIKPVPFVRGLRLLETGKGFALFPPYLYDNRRPYVHPYSKPILKEQVVVYCHNQVLLERAPELTKWPDDFYGLTIGINAAFSIGGDAFWLAAHDGKLRVEEAKDNQENILKMRGKRIDCYINDRLSIAWEIKRLKDKGRIEHSDHFQLAAFVSEEYGYLGYTAYADKFPFKDPFVARFDEVLQEIQASGIVEHVISSYID